MAKLNEILIKKESDSLFVDAYDSYGVRMGDGFVDALRAPLTPKDLVENESRMQDGKRVVRGKEGSIKMQSREVTLTFRLFGESRSELETRRKNFFDLLYMIFIHIQMPMVESGVTYKLRYTGRGISYGQNVLGTTCFVTAKFEEMNPKDRT